MIYDYAFVKKPYSMAEHRSFTDYVRTRFDSNFWAVAEEYLKNNIDDLDLNLYRVHRIGEIELSDVKVECVWVHDLPGIQSGQQVRPDITDV